MATYKLISSVTVGAGGAATIDFTSIPQTYTDLLIKLSSRTNDSVNFSENLDYRMAGITSSVYSSLTVNAVGTATGYGVETNQAEARRQSMQANNSTASTFGNIEMYFPSYTTAYNKSTFVDYGTENNATSTVIGIAGSYMANTSAINTISLYSRAGNSFLQYTTAYLYGISNA